MNNLTDDELWDRYDKSVDEDEIAAIEEQLANRKGFANVDEWYQHTATASLAAQKSGSVVQQSYTYRTQAEDATDLKVQPYYLDDQKLGSSSLSSGLCDLCSRLDFGYMLTHPLPDHELSLGRFEVIEKKTHCAFCRLVTASIQVALEFGGIDVFTAKADVEVGLFTSRKGSEIDQFDLRLHLHPWRTVDYPAISIQRIGQVGSSTAFDGRMVDPEQIDFTLVKKWVQNCEHQLEGHDMSPTKPPGKSAFTPSYLIDVHENRVVKPSKTCRYLALSYVWGGPQPLQLTLGTRDALMRLDAFRHPTINLPETIRDSMQLVGELGERYLWIDALCIVQDDDQSKQKELSVMDQVYHHAILTIVAGFGSSVHAGLPGVQRGSRNVKQAAENVRGLTLANRLLRTKVTVGKSVWNTRAWTYQERILAQRKLFISAQQVSFMCPHTEEELCEDVQSRPFRPSQLSWGDGHGRHHKWVTTYQSLDEALPTGGINTAIYASIVRQFTSRSISFPADMLNAFIGVSQRLKPLFKSEFCFGLPISELDTQLLWQPLGDIVRRRDPLTGQKLFPSWSWAGWTGPVVGNAAGCHSLSDIEFQDDKSANWLSIDQLRGMSSNNASPNGWKAHEWQGSVNWQDSGNEDVFYAHPIDGTTSHRAILPRLVDDGTGVVQALPIRAEIVSFRIDGEENLLAEMYMLLETDQTKPPVRALVLRGGKNDVCVGTVFLSDSSVQDLTFGLFDCIKIASSVNSRQWDHEPSRPMPLAQTYDQDVFGVSALDSREAIDLLVVRYEKGIARRVGVGVCHVRAFEEAKPQTREILLG